MPTHRISEQLEFNGFDGRKVVAVFDGGVIISDAEAVGLRTAGRHFDAEPIGTRPTDDPLHGHRAGRFFRACCRCHCYLTLYVFCGRHLFGGQAAVLRHRRQQGRQTIPARRTVREASQGR